MLQMAGNLYNMTVSLVNNSKGTHTNAQREVRCDKASRILIEKARQLKNSAERGQNSRGGGQRAPPQDKSVDSAAASKVIKAPTLITPARGGN